MNELTRRLTEPGSIDPEEYIELVRTGVVRSVDQFVDKLLSTPRISSAPSVRTPEQLAYDYGVPLRNRERWEARLEDGEHADDVAADLSAWTRFQRRSRCS